MQPPNDPERGRMARTALMLEGNQLRFMLDVDTAEREGVCFHVGTGFPPALPEDLIRPRSCGCGRTASYGLSTRGRFLVESVRSHDAKRHTVARLVATDDAAPVGRNYVVHASGAIQEIGT